jgi:hypothetical protein
VGLSVGSAESVSLVSWVIAPMPSETASDIDCVIRIVMRLRPGPGSLGGPALFGSKVPRPNSSHADDQEAEDRRSFAHRRPSVVVDTQFRCHSNISRAVHSSLTAPLLTSPSSCRDLEFVATPLPSSGKMKSDCIVLQHYSCEERVKESGSRQTVRHTDPGLCLDFRPLSESGSGHAVMPLSRWTGAQRAQCVKVRGTRSLTSVERVLRSF